jgi:hypothetical protein
VVGSAQWLASLDSNPHQSEHFLMLPPGKRRDYTRIGGRWSGGGHDGSGEQPERERLKSSPMKRLTVESYPGVQL